MTQPCTLDKLTDLLTQYDGVSVTKLTLLDDRAVFSLRIAEAESISRLEYFARVANAQTGAYTQCIPGGRKAGPVGKWAWRLTFELEPGVDPRDAQSIQIFVMFLVADLRRRKVLSRKVSRRLNLILNGECAA